MKIALAQFNPTVGDFSGNSARILELAAEAKKRGADLAVFSELCVCGYPPLDFLERPAFVERNRTELECLAKKLPLPAILGYVGKAHHEEPTLSWGIRGSRDFKILRAFKPSSHSVGQMDKTTLLARNYVFSEGYGGLSPTSP